MALSAELPVWEHIRFDLSDSIDLNQIKSAKCLSIPGNVYASEQVML